jgi:hypothetical protein
MLARHFAIFSSALPSQVSPSTTAAFQLGCWAKECFRASRSAGFAKGLVGVHVCACFFSFFFPVIAWGDTGAPTPTGQSNPVLGGTIGVLGGTRGRALAGGVTAPGPSSTFSLAAGRSHAGHSIGSVIDRSARKGHFPRTSISCMRNEPWNGTCESPGTRRIARSWYFSCSCSREWLTRTKRWACQGGEGVRVVSRECQ